MTQPFDNFNDFLKTFKQIHKLKLHPDIDIQKTAEEINAVNTSYAQIKVSKMRAYTKKINYSVVLAAALAHIDNVVPILSLQGNTSAQFIQAGCLLGLVAIQASCMLKDKREGIFSEIFSKETTLNTTKNILYATLPNDNTPSKLSKEELKQKKEFEKINTQLEKIQTKILKMPQAQKQKYDFLVKLKKARSENTEDPVQLIATELKKEIASMEKEALTNKKSGLQPLVNLFQNTKVQLLSFFSLYKNTSDIAISEKKNASPLSQKTGIKTL